MFCSIRLCQSTKCETWIRKAIARVFTSQRMTSRSFATLFPGFPILPRATDCFSMAIFQNGFRRFQTIGKLFRVCTLVNRRLRFLYAMKSLGFIGTDFKIAEKWDNFVDIAANFIGVRQTDYFRSGSSEVFSTWRCMEKQQYFCGFERNPRLGKSTRSDKCWGRDQSIYKRAAAELCRQKRKDTESKVRSRKQYRCRIALCDCRQGQSKER